MFISTAETHSSILLYLSARIRRYGLKIILVTDSRRQAGTARLPTPKLSARISRSEKRFLAPRSLGGPFLLRKKPRRLLTARPLAYRAVPWESEITRDIFNYSVIIANSLVPVRTSSLFFSPLILPNNLRSCCQPSCLSAPARWPGSWPCVTEVAQRERRPPATLYCK